MKGKYVQYLLGIIILTLGVSLSAKAGLGTGALDSINFALADYTGVSLAIVIVLSAVTALLIASFFRKSRPNLTTLITAGLMAIFTELWVKGFENISANTFEDQLLLFVIALFLSAIGLTLYLRAKLPAHPNDELTLALQEVFHLKLGTAKFIVDLCAMGIAVLLKGPIGLGTIFLTIGLGPMVNLFQASMNKISSCFQKTYL